MKIPLHETLVVLRPCHFYPVIDDPNTTYATASSRCRDPLDLFGDYECNRCGRSAGGLTIYALNRGLEAETDAFHSADLVDMRDRIGLMLKVLHPNHYLVLKLTKRLLDVLLLTKEPE